MTSYQAQQAAINFSLYPGSIFQGWVRVLMFTAIPAAFITHVPVEILRAFDLPMFLLMCGFAALVVGLAVVAFRIGLRRYESGNLVVLRG
jgi:ABC-2 type transport system permease protein